MSRRNEIGILVALFLVLAGVLYQNFRPEGGGDSDAPAAVLVKPLKVPNPALHLGQLARLRKLAYTGSHRNIFSATPLPPPAPAKRVVAVRDKPAPVSVAPSGPPPLQVPLKCYGMATDPKTGNKVAFFTNGDKVYIAAPGQTLLGHFRIVSIGAHSVRIEDTVSQQTGTIPMTPLQNQ